VTADFSKVTTIGTYAFRNCSNLIALILRLTDKIATLSNTNTFNNSAIANGTGYIYVPSALLSDYQAATNWNTYSAQFRVLEDYTIDGTITGALDLNKAKI
jgi:hypothetical protein